MLWFDNREFWLSLASTWTALAIGIDYVGEAADRIPFHRLFHPKIESAKNHDSTYRRGREDRKACEDIGAREFWLSLASTWTALAIGIDYVGEAADRMRTRGGGQGGRGGGSE